MKLFIDCEWNDFKGELVSMALVDEQGNSFYEVLECCEPSEWVEHNVLPVLNKAPVTKDLFDQKLEAFLLSYETIHVIADWPEDIAHFCHALVPRPLQKIGPGKMSFTVDQQLFGAESSIPHNALEDARAMRKYYMLISDDEM